MNRWIVCICAVTIFNVNIMPHGLYGSCGFEETAYSATGSVTESETLPIIPVVLNLGAYCDMSIESLPDNAYNINTAGSNPYILSKDLPKLDATVYRTLVIEYQCPTGMSYLRLFFAMDEAKAITLLSPVPASQEWRTLEVHMREVAPTLWNKYCTMLRFDFGQEAGKKINIKFIYLRGPSSNEIMQEKKYERVRKKAHESAVKIAIPARIKALRILHTVAPEITRLKNSIPTVKSINRFKGQWLEDECALLDRIHRSITRNISSNNPAGNRAALSSIYDVRAMTKRIETEVRWLKTPKPKDKRTINVKDEGARGDNTADDGPAIRAAIKRAVQDGIPEVYLPAGKYRISSIDYSINRPAIIANGMDKNARQALHDSLANEQRGFVTNANWWTYWPAHLALKNISNLTIRGEKGTEIIMGMAPIRGLYMWNCDHVTVSNIAIDYDPPTISQLTVTKILGSTSYEAALEPGFADPNSPEFMRLDFTMERYASGETIPGTTRPRVREYAPFTIGSDFQLISGNTYKVTLRNGATVVPWLLGSRVSRIARTYSQGGIMVQISKSCMFDNVTVYNSPTVAWMLEMNDLLFFKDCKTTPRPETARYSSSGADALWDLGSHFGDYISGCRFQGVNDDFLNFHSACTSIYSIENGTDVFLDFNGDMLWRPGMRLGILKTSNTIRSVDIEAFILTSTITYKNGMTLYKLVVDRPLSGVSTRTNPIDKTPDLATPVDSFCPGTIVRDSDFREGASRILLGGHNIMLQNNKFSTDLGNPEQYIIIGTPPGEFSVNETKPSGGEFYTAKNIYLLGNYVESAWSKPTILCGEIENVNVAFENNTFIQSERTKEKSAMVKLRNAFDFTFLNNTFIQRTDQRECFNIEQSADIDILFNTIVTKTPDPISISPECVNVLVKGNQVLTNHTHKE